MKTHTTLFEHIQDKTTKKRYSRKAHGGDLAQGKRKLERPLATKQWIHLVLKSQKAKGAMSFLSMKHKIFIEQLIRAKAKKFGVKLADFANVGNHLHLKIKITSRKTFQNFLRSVTARIARVITGAKKGKPFGTFWQALAYTRVLTSRREVTHLSGYMAANREEAVGGKRGRESFLAHFYDWMEGQEKTFRISDDDLRDAAFLLYAKQS